MHFYVELFTMFNSYKIITVESCERIPCQLVAFASKLRPPPQAMAGGGSDGAPQGKRAQKKIKKG